MNKELFSDIQEVKKIIVVLIILLIPIIVFSQEISVLNGKEQRTDIHTLVYDDFSIAAHPNHSSFYWSDSDLLNPEINGIEVFNGLVYAGKNGSVRGMATNRWDMLLRARHRVWGFANDDSHGVSQRGRGYSVVYSNGTKESVINSILKGDLYTSSGAKITYLSLYTPKKRITIKTNKTSWIRFKGKNGTYLSHYGTGWSYHLKGNEGYIRVQVKNADGYAWTQPFFINSDGSINNPYRFGFPNKKANFHTHGELSELSTWYLNKGYGILGITNYGT